MLKASNQKSKSTSWPTLAPNTISYWRFVCGIAMLSPIIYILIFLHKMHSYFLGMYVKRKYSFIIVLDVCIFFEQNHIVFFYFEITRHE